jgi:DNA-binding response OmpR family regulator
MTTPVRDSAGRVVGYIDDQPNRLHCHRVLVVDDERASRDFLETVLKEEPGIRIDTASTNAHALRAIRRNRPCLVLSDIMRPDGSGMELLETLRRDLPDLPVIMVSCCCMDPSYRARARRLGAVACLSKPVSRWRLLAKVRKVLGARLAVRLP